MKPRCYSSFADKRTRYVAETIPDIFRSAYHPEPGSAGVFRRWFDRVRLPGILPISNMKRVHDALRGMRYVGETDANGNPSACDEVREMFVTLTDGGDCEDFAAVQLAAAEALGLSAYLETMGEPHDNFLHADVLIVVGNDTYVSNPKGSQRGADFGAQINPYSVRRFWTPGHGNAAHEVHIAAGMLV